MEIILVSPRLKPAAGKHSRNFLVCFEYIPFGLDCSSDKFKFNHHKQSSSNLDLRFLCLFYECFSALLPGHKISQLFNINDAICRDSFFLDFYLAKAESPK